ncbi:MAG: DUF411 domain-containing protein [Mariprofundales bacterium]|nr:DUF411 domain-containing protein [Mariprofundales bacterium]
MKHRSKVVVVSLFLAGVALTVGEPFTGMAETMAVVGAAGTEAKAREVVMYKSPNCKCCSGWAEHLKEAGFTVIEKRREDMHAIKAQYGVPEKLASCHTALVGGYIIEGHVPAADVARLLKERPQVAGLTAPGMPARSPGMQAEGLPPKGYAVLAFDKDGSSHLFTQY